jgi:hypothetical protein
MRRFSRSSRAIAVSVAVAFGFLTVFVAPVQATMVGTETILQAADAQVAREKVKLFLERGDVSEHLAAWGVPLNEATARVDALTDEEVTLLAEQIDQVPAGGSDLFGIVLLIALVGFVVLVVLDIIGVTDIFTFIKNR